MLEERYDRIRPLYYPCLYPSIFNSNLNRNVEFGIIRYPTRSRNNSSLIHDYMTPVLGAVVFVGICSVITCVLMRNRRFFHECV